MPPVTIGIRNNKLWVTLEYSRTRFQLLRNMEGLHYVGEDRGGPGFELPKDIQMAKKLRDAFGDDLELTPECKAWAREHIQRTDKLARMSTAATAELERLPDVLPKLHDFVQKRKFQLADIAYMAQSPACLNANEPGTGKTVEIIGTVFEAGLENGPNLIVAPVTSLFTVWDEHLRRFDQPHPVLVAPPGRMERVRVMQRAMEMAEYGEPFWLVINPAMATMTASFVKCDDHADGKFRKSELRACAVCSEELYPEYPELHLIDWNLKVMDEFHLAGLGNPDSLTHKGFKKIKSVKTIATSGSPIGGKPIKLYGILSVLYPKDFTSKWRFANQWLVVTEEYTSHGKYKKVEGLRSDREQEFYQMMSAYMLRRKMNDPEVAADMPDTVVVDLWVDMDPKQEAQYAAFEADAEVRIDEFKIGAIGILAEYARLKQFANAEQTVTVVAPSDPSKPPIYKLEPTFNSPKLPVVQELLAERGITGDEDESEGDGVIIASESERMIKMVHTWLTQKQNIKSGLITGPTRPSDRRRYVEQFQAGQLRVMCMTTTAGGVAITLDRANTVILLDETWVPDDQEQTIARARRLSRIQTVTAYYIRTRGTIQHYIQERVENKADINRRVIDFRKAGLFRSAR